MTMRARSRTRRWMGALLLLLFALAGLVTLLPAQSSASRTQAARVPFGPGELATYQVRLGILPVGTGSLEVSGITTVSGHETFHTIMRLEGGRGPARVNDRFDSWIDTEGLFSRRFRQNQHELNFRRNRTYEFFPERKAFRRENGETGTIPTDQPLDDVSFIYYARTLPMRVGDVYELDRYFKADGNPVVLRVLRKETVDVPAGRFNTVVVSPTIQTDGLFGEGGRAEIFFTDDARRIPVLIRSRVPVIGSLQMSLSRYRAGQ